MNFENSLLFASEIFKTCRKYDQNPPWKALVSDTWGVLPRKSGGAGGHSIFIDIYTSVRHNTVAEFSDSCVRHTLVVFWYVFMMC